MIDNDQCTMINEYIDMIDNDQWTMINEYKDMIDNDQRTMINEQWSMNNDPIGVKYSSRSRQANQPRSEYTCMIVIDWVVSVTLYCDWVSEVWVSLFNSSSKFV